MAGQIIKRGENTWLVRIFDGRDVDGRRRYINKTIKGTKRKAERYVRDSMHDMDRGLFVEPSSLTLDDYLDKWLESAVRPRVQVRTADGYEALLKRYVREPLGKQRLDRLQPLDIQRVYGQMIANGLSALVVRHTHSALHNALKQAVKWRLIARNPSDLVELPRVPHKERRVLSPEEAAQFLKVARVKPHGLIFEFALLTGMRPEEYLGIQWTDLDFKRNTVRVRRAIVWHKGGWTFQETKTNRSRRTIHLLPPLMRKLKAHKRKQGERRLKLGADWEAHDLIFCGEAGNPLTIPNLTYRYFRPILENAELPRIRLYDLRHSCATLLLIADENPKVVSERLGHSTIVLTLDTYSHVLPTMQQRASERLDKLLNSAGRRKEKANL
jgi:integrase